MKKISIFLITIIIVLGISNYSHATPVFNATTGHWYDTVAGDWFTAEANAVALGGHLVTINDAAEEAWLQTTFGTSLFWIGLNDMAVEGYWVWISGEPVTYINWTYGAPNWDTEQNWVVMNWVNWGRNGWNDVIYNLYGVDGIAEWAPPVPEPATLLLIGMGLGGLWLWRRMQG